MHGTFSIEDWGQPNPRQAEVDRTRDAAARSMKAKAAQPVALTMDDVSLIRPSPDRSHATPPATDAPGQSATA